MTTSDYNPNVPLPDDKIGKSQGDFLNNFMDLYNAFNVNHVALDAASFAGNHNVIQLIEQPLPLNTLLSEISIYTKKVENQTDQIFMRFQGNGTEFQLTEYQIYSIAPTPNQEAYFTFLPGGILVYFGKVIAFGATTVNINLNPAVCQNIMGINLGGIVTAQAQPNVALQGNPFSIVILSSVVPMADQYYLIFGNII